MLTDTFFQVLTHEGVVAIASLGAEPHMANTWNSYIQVTDAHELLIPVGGMIETEKNVSVNPNVLITLGAREVIGKRGQPGTGFLIAGTAEFLPSGDGFDKVKKKYPWARAALKITIGTITQTL